MSLFKTTFHNENMLSWWIVLVSLEHSTFCYILSHRGTQNESSLNPWPSCRISVKGWKYSFHIHLDIIVSEGTINICSSAETWSLYKQPSWADAPFIIYILLHSHWAGNVCHNSDLCPVRGANFLLTTFHSLWCLHYTSLPMLDQRHAPGDYIK